MHTSLHARTVIIRSLLEHAREELQQIDDLPVEDSAAQTLRTSQAYRALALSLEQAYDQAGSLMSLHIFRERV